MPCRWWQPQQKTFKAPSCVLSDPIPYQTEQEFFLRQMKLSSQCTATVRSTVEKSNLAVKISVYKRYKDSDTSCATGKKILKNSTDLSVWVPEGYLNTVGMQRSTYKAQSYFTCSPTVKSAINCQKLFQQFELPWIKLSGNKFFEINFHCLFREYFSVVFSSALKKELVMPCRGYSWYVSVGNRKSVGDRENSVSDETIWFPFSYWLKYFNFDCQKKVKTVVKKWNSCFNYRNNCF